MRSLYFDSVDNQDYFAKINGLENRKKIRLRTYNKSKATVKLEIKWKQNMRQVKESCFIDYEDALKIQSCDFTPLLKYDNETSNRAYRLLSEGHYRPVVLTEYLRRAYIHDFNDVRVTLDSELRSSEFKFDLWTEDDNLLPVVDPMFSILEVKHDGDLLAWIQLFLAQVMQSSRSVSKYVESRWFYTDNNIM